MYRDPPYDDITSAPDSVELTDLAGFDIWCRAPHGCIVVWDRVGDAPIAHHRNCPFVGRDHFVEKVVKGGSQNGRYWWAKNSRIAAEKLGARKCRHPGDRLAR